jgi:hypothetical protein
MWPAYCGFTTGLSSVPTRTRTAAAGSPSRSAVQRPPRVDRRKRGVPVRHDYPLEAQQAALARFAEAEGLDPRSPGWAASSIRMMQILPLSD